ncbi:MAG: putative lipopolysaccharide heptosyltransferase III [Deltaproteobacteria bacterium RBG_13_58_19]|nr:MAG: putative lipopolysaccharide heptosyltransferase III [Deltaproteobacteria bacterium RBG_13_58_19]
MPSYKNILVIKLKQPGDVLVSTPVLTALKKAWPRARVTYLVPKGTEEMLTDHPLLDGLLVVDRRQETWWETIRFIRQLRSQRFDLVLELSGGDRGAWYTLITGAKERIGLARPGQPFWQRHGPFTRLLPRPPVKMHMVEQNLEALKALGLNPQNPQLLFFWTTDVTARVQELLRDLKLTGGHYVVMHPGAGWGFKCWTPTGYARIIEALQEKWRLPVVLTASRASLEQELISAILEECRVKPLSLAGQLTFKELGALIAQARFFFGVDSAPMHLAAAVNTPVVALFGPSGDYNWGPWGQGHLIIKKDWDCIPCGQDGCQGSKTSQCLTQLTPEEVLEKMDVWGRGLRATGPLTILPQTPSPNPL